VGVLVEDVLDGEVVHGLGGLHGVQLALELVHLLLDVRQVLLGPGSLHSQRRKEKEKKEKTGETKKKHP